MSIRSIGTPYGPPRPAAPTSTTGASAPAAKPAGPPAPAPAQGYRARQDSVAISDSGRALAAQPEGASSLTPERTAELRRKVLEGAYSQAGVVDQVARRLLSSGDV